MPTLLHVFEPRYRLMLRRCLESPTPTFGIVMPPRPTQFGDGNDFGTMLEIRSVRMLPDGRSMVEAWVAHRFRVLERGTLDGYMVARAERYVRSRTSSNMPCSCFLRAYDHPDSYSELEGAASAPLPPPTIAHEVSTVGAEAPTLPAALPPAPEQPDVLLAACHAFLD